MTALHALVPHVASSLFDVSDFVPRWNCGNWSGSLGWMHILSDLGIWSSYFAIPIVLAYFSARRSDLPFRVIFVLFAAFILLCGTTHLMDAIIFWWPAYRLAAWIKLATAIVSWSTVVALFRVAPRALAMRSPEALQREIRARTEAEEKLQQVNAELEERVAARTDELLSSTAAFRTSEERFRLAAEAVNGLIYDHDCKSGHVERTRGLFEVVGYRPEEVPPTAAWWRELIHPDDHPSLWKECDELTGNNLKAEYRVRHRNGQWLYVEDRAVVVRDSQGKPVRLVGCMIDVTDRKRAEAQIRETAERLGFALDAGKLGDWSWNAATDLVNLSPRAAQLFGIRSGPVMTWNEMLRLLHPEDAPSAKAAVEKSLAYADDYDVEYRVLRPDGSSVWISAKGRGKYTSEGRPVAMSGIVQDITDRKEAEEGLRDAERRKDEFIATLAHELRNPLAPIRMAVQLLQEKQIADPDFAWAADVIHRQVSQMARLLEDLLDVSRITRGKLELRRSRILLSTVISDAVETCQPAIEAGRHQLSVRLPENPISLNADRVRLAQVFLNLLNNAAKYTDRGGFIQVQADEVDGFAVVTVKDNGIGIPPAQVPRMFEMFSQATSALERSQGGLGIGLSLAKGLIELHGGTITAASEGTGKGSVFTVRLPVSAPAEERQPTETNSATVPVRPCRILVADDNADAAESLTILLAARGHEVEVAHDGEQAVRIAADFRPEIALLDIGMPKINGYDAAREIRSQPGGDRIYLVAVTGWGQKEDKERSKAAGFNLHMVKPVEFSAIQAAIAGLQHGENP